MTFNYILYFEQISRELNGQGHRYTIYGSNFPGEIFLQKVVIFLSLRAYCLQVCDSNCEDRIKDHIGNAKNNKITFTTREHF